jgi:2-dehydropantoate 2-reductase
MGADCVRRGNEEMKIAIIGAGGIGGYFGALLAAAGEDVRFVVRSRTLKALREHGLTVESPVTPMQLPSVQATDDPSTVGPADIVIFAVKMGDAQSAAGLLPPLLGPRTLVIPFQNGVEVAQLLSAQVAPAQVAGGVAYIPASLRAPGVVVHGGPFARLRFGAREPVQLPALEAFRDACKRAGIDGEIVGDIRRELWEKFVFLVGLSAMTTATRQPVGVIRADADMRAAFRAVMQETFDVGVAEGVGLAEDFVDARLAFIDTLPETMQASMLHDLQAGRPLELPWLSGAVVRLGERHRIATPVNRTILAVLKPFVAGSPPA